MMASNKVHQKHPGPSQESRLNRAITVAFKNFDSFKDLFDRTSMSVFGSGWTWLVFDKSANRLKVISLSNQDPPCLNNDNIVPVLGLDLWEHAHYLDYQNKRAKYIESWWRIVNWRFVEELFARNVATREPKDEL